MNLEQARFNMIEQQIRPWSVLDSTVLQTMGDIPRDHFVPDSFKSFAYADVEIALDHGESMMHPRVEGRMLQELEVGIEDKCLEIGTGSGYVTACLATMAKYVDSIDLHTSFLESAKNKLDKLNISNVSLKERDGLALNASNKYDAIAVTGSLPEYIPLFEELLNPNGRLFIVIGSSDRLMQAIKVKKEKDTFVRTNLFETKLNPLIGVKEVSSFSFNGLG